MCIICARIEATQHRTTSTLIHVFDMDPENAHFIYALLLCLSLDVDCVFIKVELKVFSTRRFNMNCYGNGTNERMNERTCAVALYKKNSNNNIKDQQKKKLNDNEWDWSEQWQMQVQEKKQQHQQIPQPFFVAWISLLYIISCCTFFTVHIRLTTRLCDMCVCVWAREIARKQAVNKSNQCYFTNEQNNNDNDMA